MFHTEPFNINRSSIDAVLILSNCGIISRLAGDLLFPIITSYVKISTRLQRDHNILSGCEALHTTKAENSFERNRLVISASGLSQKELILSKIGVIEVEFNLAKYE